MNHTKNYISIFIIFKIKFVNKEEKKRNENKILFFYLEVFF
jgi:hypothetical protein